MDKFLIIDGSSILFRAFYAIPKMNTKDGRSTNAVLGFTNILLNSIELINPTYIAVCFDLSEPTFRHEMYKDYKGTRSKAPEELSEQFDYIKKILTGFGIKYFEKPGFEADDLAGTLSTKANDDGIDTFLLSGDRDYMQLVDSNTELLFTKKGVSEIMVYGVNEILEEYGITPKQFIDLKALMGDKSDNIPGVPGVGEKTALKLIKEYGNLESLYADKINFKPSKVNQNIIENEEIAFISRDLATIDTSVNFNFSIEELKFEKDYSENLVKALEEFELRSIIKRLDLSSNSNPTTEKPKHNIIYDIDINEFIKDLSNSKRISFKILTDGKIYNGIKPLTLGIKHKQNVYVFDLDKYSLIDFKSIFENEKIEKVSYDIKEDIIILMNQNVTLNNYIGDLKISEYLINPVESNYSISRMASSYNFYVDEEYINYESDKKLTYFDLNLEERGLILSNILSVCDEIFPIHKEYLEDRNQSDLYYNIELPLVEVLADMELYGVYVDVNELNDIGKTLSFEIESLEKDICGLAGESFNVNSPKQLGIILFEKLQLPVIKKTKTGYSTDIEVLERLEDKHEIISYIIRYRSLTKLMGTYVEGLIKYINPETGRIHSNFSQTVAATGRLSSTEPNLQNIPVRTEEGRMFRKIFKAKDESLKLVDADYSQIELRLLADISKDENMIKAFENKEDIHSSTASKVFNKEISEVTSLMRSRAKAVNFGIVYGISDFGLSQDLKISRKEAKQYIDNYLGTYSGIAKYMEDIVETAKKDGFVETKFNRRRYLPELESRNNNIRKFGERIALNMPIQGTAADIIKIAMINVYKALKENDLKSKLILQVHDELIIEAVKSEVEIVKEILISRMQEAANLSVPLVVDVNVGDSWYETK